MKTKIIKLIVAFIMVSNLVKSQNTDYSDTIVYSGSAWEKETFLYNGVEINRKEEIYKRLYTNEQSKDYLKRASFNKKLSKISAAIGGLCLGMGGIDILSGKKFNSTLFISGAGLTLISLPLTTKYFKNMRKSVNQYNRQ